MNKAVMLCLLSLIFVQSACAASFDCDKASTKVEKMICADPELSKLDDEFSKGYQSAYDKVSSINRDQFKVNQRHWLKKRNECLDTACLRKEYLDRIAFFQGIEASAARFSSGKKLYPPYPNVWEKKIPLFNGKQSFFPYAMNDGDILISYVIGELEFPRYKHRNINFFSGAIEEELPALAGWVLRRAKVGINVPLLNNKKISLKNIDHRQPARCPQTLNFYYQIEYPDGRKEAKSILYLPDEVGVSGIDGLCVDTREKNVREPVVALQGEMLPLEDGGFLLLENRIGLVVRFDSNFNTKASFLNKKMFIVNTDDLKKKFVNEYEGMNYQQTQNAVFLYLQSLKK